MLTSQEIRKQFIDYFVQKRGHTCVASSPVVPQNDPTLLFTNAGMNQFKDVFLGTGTREYSRAVNSQKCIRAGGKHNDLEDVGKDTYHHTFFEMLGNWSFGDYFKAEAIEWAWDLLVNGWRLPAERLYVTVFEGDEADGVPPDDEAAELWARFVPPQRISRWGRKDNFWEMGDVGPCGPCSEIHIDLTADGSGRDLVNANDPRVIELWNLVFIQFNRQSSGSLAPLPARHVDTGMGLERLCTVLQNKASNYDTDLFSPLFTAIKDVTKAAEYTGRINHPLDVGYRVVADHIRCLTFAVTDGAVPGNEGRGYVLRRILRRAARHGWQTFGMRQPFLFRLVPAVVESMGDAYPELDAHATHVMDLVRDEEAAFQRTLARGLSLFEEAAQRSQRMISAADAFKLHDTYGFPVDLTQVIAQERGMTVDQDGFQGLMREARERARTATGLRGVEDALVEILQQHKLPATEFVGYTTMRLNCGRVLGCYPLRSSEDTLAVVTDKTPFYAEAGGQVGDVGLIGSFRVENTVRVGEVYFHLGRGSAPTGTVSMQVDAERRAKIMANHTATHLLNQALRLYVSPQCEQQGSLVDDHRLRFDFAHTAALTMDQIRHVEQQVNAEIAKDMPVFDGYAPLDEARQIVGLRAVFGEKYPLLVRVVSIGVPVKELLADPGRRDWADYSIELCGGTHLASTGQARRFCIANEEAVARGVRRITALSGLRAEQAMAEGAALLAQVQALDSAAPDQLAEGLAKLTEALNDRAIQAVVAMQLHEAIAELRKRAGRYTETQRRQAKLEVIEQARQIAEQEAGPLIVSHIECPDNRALRDAADAIRERRPDAALLLGTVIGDQCAFLAAIPTQLVREDFTANEWVREVAKVTGGSGGGRSELAQAGGKDTAKLNEALDVGRTYAAERLS